MRWSIKIARIAGIQLRIHITFLIFLAWIGFAYYAAGGSEAAMQGILFILLIFACVVLHEFGHAFTARRFGIRTPDITLLPIGGVARLERIPEEPKEELLIAIAGPLVNVVIAGVLIFFLNQHATATDLESLNSPSAGLLPKLASVNIFLILFNLIPAFPMDGGRILRAILAMRMNYARATRIAARVGQGLAFVFGFFGLLYNPILIFIALFVYLGAAQEGSLAQIRNVSVGLPVSEAMLTDVRTLPLSGTLETASNAVLHSSQREFPVVNESGLVVGILMRDDIIGAIRQHGLTANLADVLERHPPAVHPDAPLNEAFSKMQQCGCPALPVIDSSGRLVGLLTPERVGEMIILKSLDSTDAKPSWRLSHA
jgi:Zn-dependent protease/CBS domain-containing protein